MTTYSKFSRKQAGVLYGAIKRNEIVAPEGFTSMMYNRADAYMNHDAILDDVEARLREAVDAMFSRDLAKAQESVDGAWRVFSAHFPEVA